MKFTVNDLDTNVPEHFSYEHKLIILGFDAEDQHGVYWCSIIEIIRLRKSKEQS